MFQREGGTAFKPGLKNTMIILDKIGNPHHKFKSVHIAGTNGKGSVSHMLCAIFMKHGYKTGLYTSPHLIDYRERIRINGKKIKKKYIKEFVNRVVPLCEEIKPSFFEVTVAMAFEYFALKKVDMAIIETGMGGRLDSTNVITPVLSIITNIGYDHTQYLGNTLQKIAKEKAGIIKSGVPVLIGESDFETRDVFIETAEKNATEAVFADIYFKVKKNKTKKESKEYNVYCDRRKYISKLKSDLTGTYQTKNMTTVFGAVDLLVKYGFKLKKKKTIKALANVKQKTGLLGRWDVMQEKPLIVFDTAHNTAGITELNDQLKTIKYKRLYIIFGMVKDKETDDIFKLLPQNAFYFFTKAPMPRSMEVNDLYRKALNHGLKGITSANVKIAYMYVMNMVHEEDIVLITGSNFIVAEAFKELNFEDKKNK